MARPANCGAKEFYTAEDIAEGMGGARGCAMPGAAQADAAAAGADAGRSGARRGGEHRSRDGSAGAAVHYDTSQFGLSGNTIVRSASLRTSIITGPDGKLPPLTAEAQKRQAERARIQRGPSMGRAGNPADRRALHHVAVRGSADAVGRLQQRCSDRPGRRLRWCAAGDDSRHPHDPHQRRPALLPEQRSSVVRQSRAAIGRATSWWWRPPTSPKGPRSRTRPPPTKLKVIEKFSRIDANNVLYEFTVDDPGTWTKPWSRRSHLDQDR